MTFDQIIGAVYRREIAILRKATREDVEQTDEDGRTPLMHAILAEHPDPEVVRILLDRGADPNVADDDQHWTALHFAARDGHPDLVRLLLEAGAAVDPVDVFGNTPLWRAVFEAGDPGAIALLLEHGADPNHANAKGRSPLDVAHDVGRADLVQLLSRGDRP